MTASGAKAVTKQNTSSINWKRVLGGVLLTLGAITFFLAQSALWVSQNFFNENTFVGTVEKVLTTEESRQAISSSIVHATLQDNPVAEQLIGKQVTALVNGLLGSDLAGQVFDRVSHRAYAYLTSSDRQDIAVNLTPIKEPLAMLVNIVERTGRDVRFDPATIPDAITLVESDSLPDVSHYIRILLIANGLLWFATVAAFVSYLYLRRDNMIRAIYMVGWSIIAVSLIGLLSGPFVPPAIASLVNLIDIRGVVEDLTAAFMASFQTQLIIGIVTTGIVLLVVSLRRYIQQGAAKAINLFK